MSPEITQNSDLGQIIYGLLYDFQTLLAGILALAAAIVTVRILRKQIELSILSDRYERNYQFALSHHEDQKKFCVITEAILAEISAFTEMLEADNLLERLNNLAGEISKNPENSGQAFFFHPIPEKPYTLAYTAHIGKVPGTGYMNTSKITQYYTELMNGLDSINSLNDVLNDPRMNHSSKVEFIKITMAKIERIIGLAVKAGENLIEQREAALDEIGNFVKDSAD